MMIDSQPAAPEQEAAFDPNGGEPPPLPGNGSNTPKAPAVVSATSVPRATAKPSSPPAPKATLKTTLEMVVAHWRQPMIGLSITHSEFYELVTQAMQARNLPGVTFSRVFWKEEAFVGAKREYLRIQRGRIVCDICAAPDGAGSFLS